MKVSDFDFELPKEKIAVRPAEPRDSAKMLCVKGNKIEDKIFYEIIDELNAGDCLVLNDTKVIPVRIKGKRDAVKIEATLHKMYDEKSWWAFAKPGKRLKIDNTVVFGEGFTAKVIRKDDHNGVLFEFNKSGQELFNALENNGVMPLPPYIERLNGSDKQDASDYQTVYASNEGAVAAPTAGLHFTENLLEEIKNKGIEIVYVTLHVGAGTFMPVKVENTEDHIMHSEYGVITQEKADKLNDVHKNGGKIIAVGTTSMRLLESAVDEKGIIKAFAQETDIFITPGYKFRAVDKLITNFHLPKSTLFMLICAFAGTDNMRKAYSHAMQQDYKFYSYGDACFLEKV
ncbi:MAG: tRNA preQ1(34) S-adenosylmethionine ribosyltransferase-isomerase QueA [Alphaproteobacteria bacterium]|jgi:S-adenosylmethionine:tRNA ribosyltransferase-isomerase|nr:tRNA preQ1(34) S-adenosylmethionine ribosyltransferase-isomerase QueA [Alphaproteobacteria bacterium]